jgi:ribosomal protein S8
MISGLKISLSLNRRVQNHIQYGDPVAKEPAIGLEKCVKLPRYAMGVVIVGRNDAVLSRPQARAIHNAG